MAEVSKFPSTVSMTSCSGEHHPLVVCRLARGPCHDLLVVLLEPLEYFEMVTLQEGIAASHTLSEIDRLLRECSNGVRSISNTAVLDVRVFLTARMRATITPRELSDEEERSFAILHPVSRQLGPFENAR